MTITETFTFHWRKPATGVAYLELIFTTISLIYMIVTFLPKLVGGDQNAVMIRVVLFGILYWRYRVSWNLLKSTDKVTNPKDGVRLALSWRCFSISMLTLYTIGIVLFICIILKFGSFPEELKLVFLEVVISFVARIIFTCIVYKFVNELRAASALGMEGVDVIREPSGIHGARSDGNLVEEENV